MARKLRHEQIPNLPRPLAGDYYRSPATLRRGLKLCITIPMRVIRVEGGGGGEARGVYREVRLALLDCKVAVGDFVRIHAGYALHALSEADARATWDLFDEITSALDGAEAPSPDSAHFPDLAEGKTP